MELEMESRIALDDNLNVTATSAIDALHTINKGFTTIPQYQC